MEDIEKIKKFLNSEKGTESVKQAVKQLNDEWEKREDEEAQRKRDEIVWWHKIKDEPFTI